MGFRFRKSINLGGGFRINLSKSGIGHSWGVKGFRVTKTAKGKTRTTASIPGTGISYVRETGKAKKRASKRSTNFSGKTTRTVRYNQYYGKDDESNMTPQMNSSSNGNPQNQSPKKKSTIARWIIGIFFACCVLASGLHYSSLFVLGAAFLMCPWPFMESFLQKRNIKSAVVIILSVVLFFVGVVTTPPSESTDLPLDSTIQTTSEDTEEINNHTTSNNGGTMEPDTTESNTTETIESENTTSNDKEVTMVWVSSTGKKYHSKSSCSNMKSPSQIPLEEAIKRGFTACSKCQ